MLEVDTETVLALGPEWFLKSIPKEQYYALFNTADGSTYTLSETGFFILEHCKEGHSVGHIALDLKETFELAPDEARQDVLEFCQHLLDEGILAQHSEPS